METNPVLKAGSKTTTKVVGAEDGDYIFLLPAGETVTIDLTVEKDDNVSEIHYTIDCTNLSY